MPVLQNQALYGDTDVPLMGVPLAQFVASYLVVLPQY